MTTTTSTGASPTGTSTRPAALARRWGPWALLVAAVTLLSVLLSTQRSDTPLDPANPGPQGTQALVEVLRGQGVDVEVVRGVAGLPDATGGGSVTAGPGTTVLLSGTTYLGPEGGAALLSRVREADRLVVLVPAASQDPGEVLGLGTSTTWSAGNRLVADCEDPRVREGDELGRWDVGLDAGVGHPEVTACYPPSRGHNAGGARAGALLTYPARADRPETTLVGFPSALTNEHIAAEGTAHAALGLRLLGASPRLLWVEPQPGDAGTEGAGSLWEVLPRSLTPAMILLLGALAALALWQGRRLGPVVTEPLPAVVHASQTTRSRGRLYRQAHDGAHAYAALQEGARRRLAPRLGLPAGVAPDELARAVADATGRPPAEVERLLVDPLTPDPSARPSDTDFVTTARELRSLEEGLHP